MAMLVITRGYVACLYRFWSVGENVQPGVPLAGREHLHINGPRNRFICFWPMFQEYPHKIWLEIWYSTSILGSWNFH